MVDSKGTARFLRHLVRTDILAFTFLDAPGSSEVVNRGRVVSIQSNTPNPSDR